MIQNKDYLKDTNFLMELTKKRNKEIYVKAVSLDFQTETEIGEVQGLIINGNFSVDGASSVRRSGNLSIFCNTELYPGDPLARDINYYKKFFSISKKIDIEIGLLNDFNNNYPKIIWFQMGRYVITNASFSNNVSGGITININIGDKMNLLNGYCGGTIFSSTEIDKVSDVDETGKSYIRRASIYEMIMEMVNHFGGEQLGKILISDLDTTTKTGFKLKDSCKKQYYIQQLSTNDNSLVIKEYVEGISPSNVETYSAGDFIGYNIIDYTYPTKDYFTLNAGDSVVTGLDKIKSNIGNYEYFYDINGNFRWQEIRDYKNTSKASMDLKNIKNKDYLVDIDNGNAFYNFEDSEIIISYSNNPQYSNLKNDFVIWGTRTVGEGSNKQTFPIRYHLAIDDKPEVPVEFNDDNIYFILEDKDESDNLIYSVPIYYEKISQLPAIGEEGAIYFIQNEDSLYKYSPDNEKKYIKIISPETKGDIEIDNFYQQYYMLKDKSTDQISEQNILFSKYQNIYKNIQRNVTDIFGDTSNKKTFLNKDILIKDIDAFNLNINLDLKHFNDNLNLANQEINNILSNQYLDSNGDSFYYNIKESFPNFLSSSKMSFDNNFVINLKLIQDNLSSFKKKFLSNYKEEFEERILDYKNQIDLYYKYFLDYEKEKDLQKKEKIKNTANEIFYFSSSINIENLILNLNSTLPQYKTIQSYQKLLNKRINIVNNILKEIGVINPINQKFILDSEYKIGNGNDAQSFLIYKNTVLKNLFDNNLITILTQILDAQFEILLSYKDSFAKLWTDDLLKLDLTIQESINESILITCLFSLSDYRFSKEKIESLNIYSSKDKFPDIIDSLNEKIGYLDGATGVIYIALKKAGYYPVTHTVSMKYIFPKNWQTILFLQGMGNFEAENNIYNIELKKEWGKLFELVPYMDKNNKVYTKNNHIVYVDKIKDSVYKKSDLLDYWLDFIDSKTMDFNELKISNIGRRTLIQKNEKVNCIFSPNIPDLIIVKETDTNMIAALEQKGQNYISVSEDFYNNECESNGLTLYSAFDSISNTLYNYLNYNNTINITCLPMFFLEPNIRIKLRDEASDIYGDYIIKSFSINLNNLSTMNITCTKVIDSI